MTKLEMIYDTAHELGLEIYDFPLQSRKSLILNDCDTVSIALDRKQISNSFEEKECLIHEIGHFETGTYYNFNAKLDTIGRKEYRANRWAIMNYLPFEDLLSAFKEGITGTHELAEHFEHSEDSIKLAIEIYTRQGKLPIHF